MKEWAAEQHLLHKLGSFITVVLGTALAANSIMQQGIYS